MVELEFPKRKKKLTTKADWRVAERTKFLIKQYALFVDRTEDEIVDEFLWNLMKDKEFVEWVQNKRRNKRAMAQLFSDVDTEESDIV